MLASRYDNGRTGANLAETILTTRNVNSEQFGRLPEFVYDTRADVYAQPLFVSDLEIQNRGRRNVVFVANVNNDVFAFDADGPLSGESGTIWSRNLGTPETIIDALGNEGDGNVHKGGNLGILGTPVIDRERGIMFLVSRQKRVNRNPHSRFEEPFIFSQWLHALDIRTGAEKTGSPIEIRASKRSSAFNPRIQNQRAGLALSRGHVVIAWGSNQDEELYYGWVMSYRFDEDNFAQTGVFVTTLAGDPFLPRVSYICLPPFPFNKCALGGVWQSGRAPAVDSRGRILLFVGNGHNNTSDEDRKVTSFGNSFVILDPESLDVLDFFTPSNFERLNLLDNDFGGSGPMIIPGSTFEAVVGGGKEGWMHVWHLSRGLGGYTPNDLGAVQRFLTGDVKNYGILHGGERAGHIMGGPVYWNGPDGALLYNWSEDSELKAYTVDPTAPAPITIQPSRIGTFKLDGHPGGILTLSANGAQPDSGIVWAATYDPGEDTLEGALHKPKPGNPPRLQRTKH